MPLSELILTTRPFDSSRSGANAFVMRYGPYMLTLKMKSRSFSSTSMSGATTTTPALFTTP